MSAVSSTFIVKQCATAFYSLNSANLCLCLPLATGIESSYNVQSYWSIVKWTALWPQAAVNPTGTVGRMDLFLWGNYIEPCLVPLNWSIKFFFFCNKLIYTAVNLAKRAPWSEVCDGVMDFIIWNTYWQACWPNTIVYYISASQHSVYCVRLGNLIRCVSFLCLLFVNGL